MWTRQHFNLVARVLRGLGADGALCFDDPDDREAIADKFANALAHENRLFDQFDFVRFIKATRP